MPKRDVVRPNINSIAKMVSDKSWSEASFSQMVGKHKRWISEVRRGKNLPSPEEAARMCVLLQTTPEEILVKQDEIDLVNLLLDNNMAKGKAPATVGEGEKDALIKAVREITDKDTALAVFDELSKKMRELM